MIPNLGQHFSTIYVSYSRKSAGQMVRESFFTLCALNNHEAPKITFSQGIIEPLLDTYMAAE
jgi:hypothetical protein